MGLFLSWCWPSLGMHSESLRVRGKLTAGFCAVHCLRAGGRAGAVQSIISLGKGQH